MGSSMAPASSSSYDQEEKVECRRRVINHAVKSLTAERRTSACVQRIELEQFWKELKKHDNVQENLSQQEIEDVTKEVEQWKLFHDSQIQTRTPSDLRVCYLGGDNPINDLRVFVDHGVLCQNVWAIEKNENTLEKAWKSIEDSNLRNVRMFKGDILDFLKELEGQFDIIYYDACGSLPSSKQMTLKVIGYVFLYDKLRSPGALITNFSFPPKLGNNTNVLPSDNEREERDNLKLLTQVYLQHRLLNTTFKLSPHESNRSESITKFLKKRTVEENYSDYITYQVIDSACLMIPALRMLSSKERSLWDQLFVNKEDFVKELESYKTKEESAPQDSSDTEDSPLPDSSGTENSPPLGSSGTEDISPPSDSSGTNNSPPQDSSDTEDISPPSDSSGTNNSPPQDSSDTKAKLKNHCKSFANKSYIEEIGSGISLNQSIGLCKAWMNQIFPNWRSLLPKNVKKHNYISILLLTHLLCTCQLFVKRFFKGTLQKKCFGPLFDSLHEKDDEESEMEIKPDRRLGESPPYDKVCLLVAGLLYGQLAHPSFPVLSKLLRLQYTAKRRQMFCDVIIFDKCRYIYEQFPTVDCACFAMNEEKQRVVICMVVAFLRKHLENVYQDVFHGCDFATLYPEMSRHPGGVSFPNIPHAQYSIGEREVIDGYLGIRAIKFVCICLLSFPFFIKICLYIYLYFS